MTALTRFVLRHKVLVAPLWVAMPAAGPALVALFGRTNWWLPHTPGCFGSSPPQTRPSQRPTRRRSAPGASRR